jgi:hypothetical protein
MTFAIAVIPSGQVVSVGRPAQHPKLIGRRRSARTQWRADVRPHRARGLTAVLERTDHLIAWPSGR